MTDDTKAKVQSIWLTLGPIIGAVILALGLCGLYVYSGKELTVEAITAICVVVAGLMFIRGRKGSGGSAPMIGGGILAIAAIIMPGCAPCLAERAVVSALDVAVDASEDAVGDQGSDGWDIALDVARLSVIAGEAGVEACELVRDGAEWQAFVRLALERFGALAAYFGASRLDGASLVPSTPTREPPAELIEAVEALQAEVE